MNPTEQRAHELVIEALDRRIDYLLSAITDALERIEKLEAQVLKPSTNETPHH